MSSFSMQVTGLAELTRNLRQLPQELQQKALHGMVQAAATVVRDEAVRRAPVYVGKVGKRHPRPGTLKAAIYQTRLPSECTPTVEVWKVSVHRKGRGAAWYAHMVEYGTVNMAARPFMRPAFEARKADAVEAMRAHLAQRLPALASALARRAA